MLCFHLGDHVAEGPVESVRVQDLREILADFLQSSKGSLKYRT